MKMSSYDKAARILKKISGVSLVILLSGASVAFAALTLTGTAVTSDGALTLTGSGASTLDVGTGLLSIQTANNGPITLGTGLFTIGGAVNVSSTLNVSSTTNLVGVLTAGSSTVSGILSTKTLHVSSTLNVVASSTFRGPINSTGTVDTVAVCGTSPAIVGANGIGQITTGSDASSTCTITFGQPFTNKPSCNIRTETTAQMATTSTIITPSATTLVVSQSSSSQFNATVFDYQCIGR
jgi:cytoskeletal protein CcmA (bactofilin family)